MPPPREVNIRPRHGMVARVEPSCHAHGHVDSIARRPLGWTCRCWARRGRAGAGWSHPLIWWRWRTPAARPRCLVIVLALAAERPFPFGHVSGLFVVDNVDANCGAISLFVDGPGDCRPAWSPRRRH
jgi:hypothetical protein